MEIRQHGADPTESPAPPGPGWMKRLVRPARSPVSIADSIVLTLVVPTATTRFACLDLPPGIFTDRIPFVVQLVILEIFAIHRLKGSKPDMQSDVRDVSSGPLAAIQHVAE